MLEKLKKRFKNEKGFTLVELLAVIVILGIILAIAIPSIGNIVEKSKINADEANVALIENAARLADVSGEFEDGMSPAELYQAGYLDAVPLDPTNDDAEYGGMVTKVAPAGGSETANKSIFEYTK